MALIGFNPCCSQTVKRRWSHTSRCGHLIKMYLGNTKTRTRCVNVTALGVTRPSIFRILHPWIFNVLTTQNADHRAVCGTTSRTGKLKIRNPRSGFMESAFFFQKPDFNSNTNKTSAAILVPGKERGLRKQGLSVLSQTLSQQQIVWMYCCAQITIFCLLSFASGTTDLRRNPVYRYFYSTALFGLVMYVIPLAILGFLNIRVMMEMKKAKQNWETLNRKQKREVRASVMPLVNFLAFEHKQKSQGQS